MAIQNLNQGTLTSASQIPFGDVTNGVDSRASMQQLIDLVSASATVGSAYLTQYAAPGATGFSVSVSPMSSGGNVLLLLTPAATYAAGTIVLPEKTSCIDGQELMCTCTQIVTALTVSGNGATVNGAPTALAVNGFFRLRFDAVFSAWYRVG